MGQFPLYAGNLHYDSSMPDRNTCGVLFRFELVLDGLLDVLLLLLNVARFLCVWGASEVEVVRHLLMMTLLLLGVPIWHQ